MTRTAAREIAVHFCFELGFTGQSAQELLDQALTRQSFALIGEEEPLYAEFPNQQQREYITTLVKGVYSHGPELDEYISRYAIGWSFSRLINEAVELTKHYEEPEVVSFVNGILGTFVRQENIPDRAAAPAGVPEE